MKNAAFVFSSIFQWKSLPSDQTLRCCTHSQFQTSFRRTTTPTMSGESVLIGVDLDVLCSSRRESAARFFSLCSKSEIFCVYYTHLTLADARNRVLSNDIILSPDAWICEDGAALFQRRYSTPDPYYAELVWKNWDPKPLAWTFLQHFDGFVQLEQNSNSTNSALNFQWKGNTKAISADLIRQIECKLGESGFSCKVYASRLDAGRLLLGPKNLGVAQAFTFVGEMLQVPSETSCILASCASITIAIMKDFNVRCVASGNLAHIQVSFVLRRVLRSCFLILTWILFQMCFKFFIER